jgi:hypothetical protein
MSIENTCTSYKHLPNETLNMTDRDFACLQKKRGKQNQNLTSRGSGKQLETSSRLDKRHKAENHILGARQVAVTNPVIPLLPLVERRSEMKENFSQVRVVPLARAPFSFLCLS